MSSLPNTSVALPVSVALIGVGGYGEHHLRCLRALESEGMVRLEAVADPSPHLHPETHASLTASGVRWYPDYRQLLGDEPRLGLVVIATPIHLHEPMTRAALARPGLHVLLEKPPVPTLAQLHALIAADPDTRVHVGFQMVAYPAVRRLQGWLAEGRLGELRRITATAVWPRDDLYYRRAGWAGRMVTDAGEPVFDGPATNALAHLAHNVMLLGSHGHKGDGVKVEGRFTRPALVRGEFRRARRDLQSYDAACITGRLRSGVDFGFAAAHCSRHDRPFTIHLQGSAGEATIGSNGGTLRASFAPGEEYDNRFNLRLHRETLERIRRGEPPLTSLRDCLGYSELTCGGLLSSGGVHGFSEECVAPGEPGASGVWHVEGLAEAVDRLRTTGQSWSEQDTAWGPAPSVPLDPAGIDPGNFDLVAPARRPAGQASTR